MRKVITYGTFDLLHRGHVALLERAKSLGDYLIVGVTADQFDRERGKLSVVQSTLERVDAVRATGLADLVVIEEYEGQKIEDVKRYGVDIFTVGSDWVGHFDYLSEWCEVVYLDRTDGVSSTMIREEMGPSIRVGVFADETMALRYVPEIESIGGMEFAGMCDPLLHAEGITPLIDSSDALILSAAFPVQANLVSTCLSAGRHVLYASPAFDGIQVAKNAMSLAEEKGLVLFEGCKTLYFPAFEHLLLLVESGRIGEVRDIEFSCSQIPEGFDLTQAGHFDSAVYDWGVLASMPVAQLLGTKPEEVVYKSFSTESGCAYLTRCHMSFSNSTASFKLGRGIKTEGDMVITGTKGYVYVPSPWWLADYFEIRYEDLTQTRKYYWEYQGEGFRHELLEFARRIRRGSSSVGRHGDVEHVWTARLIEEFEQSLGSKM